MKINRKIDTGCYIAGWCILLALCVAAAAVKISGIELYRSMPQCMFHALTGYYCPGCGGTRAVFSLFAGRLMQSFRYHPLVLYAAVSGGWFMLSQTVERISKGRFRIGMHFREIYLWIALGIILVNCLIKNLALILCHTDLLL